jgi:hypothetical protein
LRVIYKLSIFEREHFELAKSLMKVEAMFYGGGHFVYCQSAVTSLGNLKIASRTLHFVSGTEYDIEKINREV